MKKFPYQRGYKQHKILEPKKICHQLTFFQGDPDRPCLDGLLLKGIQKVDYSREVGEFGTLNLQLCIEPKILESNTL